MPTLLINKKEVQNLISMSEGNVLLLPLSKIGRTVRATCRRKYI